MKNDCFEEVDEGGMLEIFVVFCVDDGQFKGIWILYELVIMLEYVDVLLIVFSNVGNGCVGGCVIFLCMKGQICVDFCWIFEIEKVDQECQKDFQEGKGICEFGVVIGIIDQIVILFKLIWSGIGDLIECFLGKCN